MSNIAIIPQVNLPAALMQQFAQFTGSDDLDAGVSAGFPVMSLRGAKWRIVEGGEEHPIYMAGTKDLAPSIKVVLMRANSALSKTYYAGAFVEGSDAKPDCSSNDGVVPSPDSPKPQCTTCAACPQNVWGSKISPSGAKIKACADVRRLAILPAEDMEYSPILLRIPGASLSDLAAYGKALKQRGIPYAAVVTKLSFDPDASFPKVLFQFDRVLSQDEMAHVAERLSEPVIEDILGLSAPRGAAPALAAPAGDKFGIPADAALPAGNASAPVTQTAGGFSGGVQTDSSAAAGVGTAQSETASAPAAEKAKPVRKAKGFGAAPEAAAAPTEAEADHAPAPTPAPAAAGAGSMMDDINNALANLQL